MVGFTTYSAEHVARIPQLAPRSLRDLVLDTTYYALDLILSTELGITLTIYDPYILLAYLIFV